MTEQYECNFGVNPDYVPTLAAGALRIVGSDDEGVVRVVELAEAAVAAQTPVWIVGKAYSDSDPYGRRFHELARKHPDIIRYEGAINDRARSFVHLERGTDGMVPGHRACSVLCIPSRLPLKWTFSRVIVCCSSHRKEGNT